MLCASSFAGARVMLSVCSVEGVGPTSRVPTNVRATNPNKEIELCHQNPSNFKPRLGSASSTASSALDTSPNHKYAQNSDEVLLLLVHTEESF